MAESGIVPAGIRLVEEEYRLEDCFERQCGRIYLTGIQALVRLPMLQRRLDRRAGLATRGLVAGYRGSPLAGYDLALAKAARHLHEHDILFQPAINEELAATMIAGSQQAEADGSSEADGVFGIWYGKGPGVDRAGDAIKHGHAYGSSPHGGVLVVAGDDHGAVSSTISHQSDQAFVAWSMPVLNPVDLEDYLHLGAYGIALSRFSGAWVGFKAISETVEGGRNLLVDEETLRFIPADDYAPPPGGLHFRYDDPPSVVIEERLSHKLEAARAFARANLIDDLVIDNERAWLGIVTVGKAHGDLMEAFRQLGFGARDMRSLGIRLLNIKQSFPLEPVNMRRFASGLKQLLVVEEKRPLVEDQITTLLYAQAQRPAVIGKTDAGGVRLLSDFGELRAHRLAPAIADLLMAQRPELDLAGRLWRSEVVAQIDRPAVQRMPHFCSGCPHSSSTKLPDDAVAFGGIGCHVMATWMDRGTRGITQMGGEGSNWVGLAPFTKRKHAFQNLGDGTYFHSGLLSIRQAVAAKTPITFKLLYNDAVAMTGGQAHDGALSVGNIAHQLVHEGVGRIVVVTDETHDYRWRHALPAGIPVHGRDQLNAVQHALADYRDVSVLIYDQTCAAEKRRRRKRGQYPDPARRAFINELVCEACGDCSRQSNCLSIATKESRFGVKRQIDQSSCNKDFSCIEGFCPSFVTVEGGRLRDMADDGLRQNLMKRAAILPDIIPPEGGWAGPEPFEILVTGIGGTGVLTIGALISMAAHLDGLSTSVLDFTGLAQKGGAVLSHVRIARGDRLHQGRIEPGDACAVIGCDLIVATGLEAMSTIRRGRTQIVGNGHVQPTSGLIKDPAYRIDTMRLRQRLEKRAGTGSVSLIDATKLAERLFSDSIKANILITGFAYQKGLIPVSIRAIERAIELNGVDPAGNLEAFSIGRLIAADGDAAAALLDPPAVQASLEEMIEDRAAFLVAYQDEDYASEYRYFVDKIGAAERDRLGPGEQRLQDAVARNLFKLMAYKDEYEVARLYTDGGFASELNKHFDGRFKVKFHMAPPLLERVFRQDGKPAKLTFGAWMMPAMRLLAGLRFLRGGRFDPFGYHPDRRLERALIADYKEMVERSLSALNASRHDKLVRLAEAADGIRGFGHVKRASIDRYQTLIEAIEMEDAPIGRHRPIAAA